MAGLHLNSCSRKELPMSETTSKLFCDSRGVYYIADQPKTLYDQYLPFTIPLNVMTPSMARLQNEDVTAEMIIEQHPISDVHPIDLIQEAQKSSIEDKLTEDALLAEQKMAASNSKSSSSTGTTGIVSSSSLTSDSVKVSSSSKR